MGHSGEPAAVNTRHVEIGETVSALMDGFVDEVDMDVTYRQVIMSEGKNCWNEYHLIGEALQSPELPELERSVAFMARFSTAFDSEPHLLAPLLRQQPRWFLLIQRALPATAAAAVAATMTWLVIPKEVAQPSVTTVVAQTGHVTNTAQFDNNMQGKAVMLRDASLDDYLRAHGQFASRPAAPYIRAAVVSQED